MIKISKTSDWTTLQKDAQAIRYAVFVEEQKIPAELGGNAMDALCLHAVAYDENNQQLHR